MCALEYKIQKTGELYIITQENGKIATTLPKWDDVRTFFINLKEDMFIPVFDY